MIQSIDSSFIWRVDKRFYSKRLSRKRLCSWADQRASSCRFPVYWSAKKLEINFNAIDVMRASIIIFKNLHKPFNLHNRLERWAKANDLHNNHRKWIKIPWSSAWKIRILITVQQLKEYVFWKIGLSQSQGKLLELSF